ncbi:hypothetical protein F4775DRAFT_540409 [Biscogniauxia sp. FL1348]|nr:hypothetical protein F4775DRAFT_540409 [Biscogniauxia sp. FL1348]
MTFFFLIIFQFPTSGDGEIPRRGVRNSEDSLVAEAAEASSGRAFLERHVSSHRIKVRRKRCPGICLSTNIDPTIKKKVRLSRKKVIGKPGGFLGQHGRTKP